MMRRLAPIFGFIALVLLGFVAVGLFLPGTWEAEYDAELSAPIDVVFPFVSDLRRWDEWTVWSEVDSEFGDVVTGVGASRSWDDETYGEGTIRLTAVDTGARVVYEVLIEDGASRVDGTLTLDATATGTRVHWREAGDFGWNPLMGYMARRMPESQAAQMEESLSRLEVVIRRVPPPDAADTESPADTIGS